MSTPTLARRERHALCDTAVTVDPGAPTLCEDWTAIELLAHLFVREHRPLAAAGTFVPALSRLTDAAMARAVRTGYPALVEKVREPGLTPFALRPVEVLANTLEYVVHHEDLRRGTPGWEPRDLPAADLDEIWGALGRMGKMLVRAAGAPVTVVRSDTGERSVLKAGDDPVVLTGPVLEVLLFVFGRRAVRDVVLDGPPAAVAAYRDAEPGF